MVLPCKVAALLGALAAAGCAAGRPGARAEVRFGTEAGKQGLWREAALRFEKATRATPLDPAAWNGLAVARETEGRILEAFEAYRRAVELRPRDRRIRGNFDRFLARNRERIVREGAAAAPAKPEKSP